MRLNVCDIFQISVCMISMNLFEKFLFIFSLINIALLLFETVLNQNNLQSESLDFYNPNYALMHKECKRLLKNVAKNLREF